MEGFSLDKKLTVKIDQHVQLENIINSCVEKIHLDENIDSNNKNELFRKCVKSKVNLYNQINQKNSQNI